MVTLSPATDLPPCPGQVPDDRHSVDLRLAVLGNADVGKSTLLGVLTYGELDNGRGRSRLNMLRHLHEIRTGRTSSISHEILGFDSEVGGRARCCGGGGERDGDGDGHGQSGGEAEEVGWR